MKHLLQDSTLSLRPHYKSHKCAAIAHMQIEDGAVGMTCAKLDEAVDLADSGIENILIANQITDHEKIMRGAFLAGKCTLTVCVDDSDNVSAWEQAAAFAGTNVRCLIEYEIGMRRCGLESETDVLSLAAQIAASPHLTFEGIQAYAGHLSHMTDAAERMRLTNENNDKVRNLLAFLENNGYTVRTVSGGSTGTAMLKAGASPYTELQAGSYLFMDSSYAKLGLPFENALTLLTSVVSTKESLTVVDAGVKSCGVDQGMPEPIGFTAEEIVASEEHFQLHRPSRTHVCGERIWLLPAHCCSTVNLHDKIYVADGEKIIDRLQITARGCFR